MTTFLIQDNTPDEQTPEQRLRENNCHLDHGEFVLLRHNVLSGMQGKIGQVMSVRSEYGQKIDVAYKQAGETKLISVSRGKVYHLPSNIWIQIMFRGGTNIRPADSEAILEENAVKEQLNDDARKRTWNAGEMVALGGKNSKRTRFDADASNPFLVMIQSKL